MSGPCEGMRVVNLTTVVMGPIATRRTLSPLGGWRMIDLPVGERA